MRRFFTAAACWYKRMFHEQLSIFFPVSKWTVWIWIYCQTHVSLITQTNEIPSIKSLQLLLKLILKPIFRVVSKSQVWSISLRSVSRGLDLSKRRKDTCGSFHSSSPLKFKKNNTSKVEQTTSSNQMLKQNVQNKTDIFPEDTVLDIKFLFFNFLFTKILTDVRHNISYIWRWVQVLRTDVCLLFLPSGSSVSHTSGRLLLLVKLSMWSKALLSRFIHFRDIWRRYLKKRCVSPPKMLFAHAP